MKSDPTLTAGVSVRSLWSAGFRRAPCEHVSFMLRQPSLRYPSISTTEMYQHQMYLFSTDILSLLGCFHIDRGGDCCQFFVRFFLLFQNLIQKSHRLLFIQYLSPGVQCSVVGILIVLNFLSCCDNCGFHNCASLSLSHHLFALTDDTRHAFTFFPARLHIDCRDHSLQAVNLLFSLGMVLGKCIDKFI